MLSEKFLVIKPWVEPITMILMMTTKMKILIHRKKLMSKQPIYLLPHPYIKQDASIHRQTIILKTVRILILVKKIAMQKNPPIHLSPQMIILHLHQKLPPETESLEMNPLNLKLQRLSLLEKVLTQILPILSPVHTVLVNFPGVLLSGDTY